jgi:DNA-binding MarR family transcriptional regulator
MSESGSDAPSDNVILAWALLVRSGQSVLGAVEADLKRAKFPPLGWYDVLLELRRAGDGGLRPFEIEERLLLAQHNVSRLVDRIVAAGLAERQTCPTDGRGQVVVITGKGRDLLIAMWPIYRAAIARHVAERLSDTEAAALARLLAKLLPEQG